MAKRLFLLVAGALALTACTNEEVIDDVAASRNVIKFENAVNKLSRATDLDFQTLLKFNVYGFYIMPDNPKHVNEVFNNELVTKNGGQWYYNNTRYWVPGATYYFYAYSCGSVSELNKDFGVFNLNMDNFDENGKELNLAATDRTLKIENYISDHTHQHDLVFASSSVVAKDNNNSDVSFEFKHILTKLQAKFTSKFPKEYTLVISDVSVGNIRNIGDYDFTINEKQTSDEEQTSDEDQTSNENQTSTEWVRQERTPGQPYVYLLNTKATEYKKDLDISVKNQMVKTIIDGVETEIKDFAQTNTAYVIPYKYDQNDVFIAFDIKVMYGADEVIGTKRLSTTFFAPEWKKGFSYIYNIAIGPDDLKMDEITFTVSEVGGWTDDPYNNTSNNDLAIKK